MPCKKCGRPNNGRPVIRPMLAGYCWAPGSDADVLECERLAHAAEITTLREKLAAAEQERDEANKQRDWWRKAALDEERQKNEAALVAQAATGALSALGPAVGEVLNKIQAPDGATAELRLPAPAAVIASIVEAMKGMLTGDPPPVNYMEMQFTDATDGARYAAIIVKPDGKTPHQLRQEAESRATAEAKRADALAERLDWAESFSRPDKVHVYQAAHGSWIVTMLSDLTCLGPNGWIDDIEDAAEFPTADAAFAALAAHRAGKEG